MDGLGNILLNAKLITHDELKRAAAVQARTNSRLARILVDLNFASQDAITQAWAHATITPSLTAEIDRNASNQFSAHPQHTINYITIHRRDTIIEDMLNDAALVTSDVTYTGTCTLSLGKPTSPPIEFELDTQTHFATLLGPGPAIARRWVDLVRRGVAKDAA